MAVPDKDVIKLPLYGEGYIWVRRSHIRLARTVEGNDNEDILKIQLNDGLEYTLFGGVAARLDDIGFDVAGGRR